MKYVNAFLGSFFCLWLGVQPAQAGVVINGTRVIYDGSRREAGIAVSNPDKATPYLMQSWIENFSSSNAEKVPFIITPPLFRLDAQRENVLRIVHVGAGLPDDRESVFLLNIKSIPATQKTDENELQISVKAQLKLFYRPTALKSINADDAYKQLTFSRQGSQLVVNNPTPFYISFYSVSVDGKAIDKPSMVEPKGSLQWPLTFEVGKTITWQTINDYGGITPVVQSVLK